MKNEFKSYDINKSIIEYMEFSERTLEGVVRKIIENRYDSSSVKRTKLIRELEEFKW